ncbi:MAG: replication factor C small subunit [Candidatus Micrarchaeota archaeon]|nr:replication factor C small subunit [Candidatus Micrarchaeota archaeon]
MELPWTEKYRPSSLADVAGQTEIIERLAAFVKGRSMPNLLFAGGPGVGKTTATLALAQDLFGKDYRGSLLELNASDERGIDVVRGKIKDFARTIPLSAVPFKLIFLDEADALTSDAQQALRRTMEMYSSATRFILSCNYSSKIIEPIQSRCAVFRFRPLAEEDVMKMLGRIAQAEQLHVDPKAYKAIIYISEGDMRRAINSLQGASMMSKNIKEETIFKASSRAKPEEILQMLDLALKGKFTEAREKLDKVMVDYGMGGEEIMLQMYREITSLDIPDRKKVELVDKIGEYNFRLTEGANERIQLEALLARIMLIGKE